LACSISISLNIVLNADLIALAAIHNTNDTLDNDNNEYVNKLIATIVFPLLSFTDLNNYANPVVINCIPLPAANTPTPIKANAAPTATTAHATDFVTSPIILVAIASVIIAAANAPVPVAIWPRLRSLTVLSPWVNIQNPAPANKSAAPTANTFIANDEYDLVTVGGIGVVLPIAVVPPAVAVFAFAAVSAFWAATNFDIPANSACIPIKAFLVEWLETIYVIFILIANPNIAIPTAANAASNTPAQPAPAIHSKNKPIRVNGIISTFNALVIFCILF